MKKARKFDPSSMRTLNVRIEGVEVRLYVDANGWPCGATSSFWHSDEQERLVRLAIGMVRRQAILAAQASAKAGSDATRTKKSTDTKREKAAEHFSRKWLAAALKKKRNLGADRLALSARRLLAAKPGDPDYTQRERITEYRAKQYLRGIKNSGDM